MKNIQFIEYWLTKTYWYLVNIILTNNLPVGNKWENEPKKNSLKCFALEKYLLLLDLFLAQHSCVETKLIPYARNLNVLTLPYIVY